MSGKTILSIDGGGIRGVIPATVLREIEARTDQPVASLFDVIAGTSTGGILALGLTCPKPGSRVPHYSVAALVGLYRDEGPRIFPHEFSGRLRQVGRRPTPRTRERPSRRARLRRGPCYGG